MERAGASVAVERVAGSSSMAGLKAVSRRDTWKLVKIDSGRRTYPPTTASQTVYFLSSVEFFLCVASLRFLTRLCVGRTNGRAGTPGQDIGRKERSGQEGGVSPRAGRRGEVQTTGISIGT